LRRGAITRRLAPAPAGARERHHHFADRAVYDVAERAWLDHFIDGWLARRQVLAQAAE